MIQEQLNQMLLDAAYKDYVEVVKETLEKGADINAKDRYGNTSLHWATNNENADLVTFLLKKGADVNAKDNDGYTPLRWASPKGNTEIAELLKKHEGVE